MEEPNRDAVDFHSELASSWDENYRAGSFRRRAQFVSSQLGLSPRRGERWLDAGCGTGFFSRLLASQGAQVVAIDASAKMLERARELSAGVEITYESVATLEALPFEEAQFDGCICFSVVEYLEQPELGVAELSRVLKAGGTLHVSVPNRFSAVRHLQSARVAIGRALGFSPASYLDVSRNTFRRNDLWALLERHGLSPTMIADFDPYLFGAFLRVLPASLLFAQAKKLGGQ